MPGLLDNTRKMKDTKRKVEQTVEEKSKKQKLGNKKQELTESFNAKQTLSKSEKSTPGPEPAAAEKLTADEYRKQHDITIKSYGHGSPPVYQTFEEAPFPAPLKSALLAAGFAAPSPIQAQSWPLALTGRDILATAKTGSGKTCGYLLPSIANYMSANAGKPVNLRPSMKGSPSILVMSPTRELAMQIHQQATTFAKAAGLRSVAVYGGAPKGPQIRDLKMGAQIVIATPGRLNDLLVFECQDGSVVMNLDNTNVLVLDEADRMCDMGFEEDIKKIVAQMPATKQTLFFTATWPKAVARVAASILRNPIQISIGSCDELRANKDIKQTVQVTGQSSKRDLLMAMIKKEITPESRCIIFCNKKYICDELENSIWEAGYNVAAIHGDKTQADREWAIAEIRAGRMPLLVATDVAARGLDIKGMDRVINFDFPMNTEDYVHRIGRTGRAGASGTAHTFFTAADAKHAKELVKIMKEAKQVVPSELESMMSSCGGYGASRGNRGQGGGNKWRGGGRGGGANSWGKKW
ncbi:hypothetical protein CEUSTIGMA_g6439.t1 [Chlamydomonas eustigma]|uniref:RNA helicase n=1 Tax=Chlamydomonas eustigma TaxID=1157962 RepID=A0A250X7V2_9CHLO|nr:hypothetical protein CEUSTIGMA_g6439.t1 [Chlamydomonas eustigma]|eukprot:GAX78999.1 hypothetical protein CEUSTIGMA_g6439.t1 [Chlamydomonas eustigma]